MEKVYRLDDYGDVLTAEEMRQVLRIGRNAAYILLKNGQIKSVMVAGKYIIPKKYILDYLGIA